MANTQFNVNIPQNTMGKLKDESAKTGNSVASVIRSALAERYKEE